MLLVSYLWRAVSAWWGVFVSHIFSGSYKLAFSPRLLLAPTLLTRWHECQHGGYNSQLPEKPTRPFTPCKLQIYFFYKLIPELTSFRWRVNETDYIFNHSIRGLSLKRVYATRYFAEKRPLTEPNNNECRLVQISVLKDIWDLDIPNETQREIYCNIQHPATRPTKQWNNLTVYFDFTSSICL